MFNRRHYDQRLDAEVKAARRARRSLALLLLDIDHFKACNDRHGHEHGDRVLVELAALLGRHLRTRDMLARYGGEEFAILLAGGADEPAALARAEELRAAVQAAAVAGRPAGAVTVSIGVAALGGEELEQGALFRRADAGLYAAKAAGRNRCATGAAPMSSTQPPSSTELTES